MHCSQLTKSTIAGWKKKKRKKKGKRGEECRRGFQLKANGHIMHITYLIQISNIMQIPFVLTRNKKHHW